MNITNLLQGTTPGTIQQVGYMSIIPIIKEKQDADVCDPTKILLGTRNYGHMEMENPTDRMAILPFGTGVMTKQAAQNHATPKAKLIKSKGREVIDYAACIQQTQGGLIGKGEHEITILPWALKEISLQSRNDRAFQKLWPPIQEFNNSLGVRVTGHLELYLEQFKDELDTFIAQFEIVPGQVGAIILINGYVMGIELAPNYDYFKAIWKPLIRESYGSLVLQYVKHFGDKPPVPRTRVPLNTNVKNLTDLQKELVKTQKEEDERVKSIIRKFVREDFEAVTEEKVGSYKVETVKNKQFAGQVVTKTDGDVSYVSLVTSASGIKNQKSYEKSEFTI